MHIPTSTRLAAFAFALASLTAPAHAVPPPDRPLPPCEDSDGFKSGACPRVSPEVDGTGVGRLIEYLPMGVYVEPAIPACNTWDKNGTGLWAPDPCYPAVEKIEVVGCAYVDIRGGGFVERPCASALYQSGSGAGFQLKVENGPNGTCGGDSAFWTYYYGGPATQPDQIWAARGPRSTHCQLTLMGDRPDGLYGPTWVKLKAGIEVVTGVTTSSSGPTRWTEFYVPVSGDLRDLGPVAGFRVSSNEGGRVVFENTSVHTMGEAMTYHWDFGDGGTSSAKDPEHRFTASGTYRVTLTARDASGDEDQVTVPVVVDLALIARLKHEPRSPQVGEAMTVTLEIENPFDRTVSGLALIGATGLRSDPAFMMQTEGPTPEAPTSLAPGEKATFTYMFEPLQSGRSVLEGGAMGRLDGIDVTKTVTAEVMVPARLEVELTSTVDSQTKVGDTFEVFATLTNNEEVELTHIKSEPLSLSRSDLLEYLSGPVADDGSDPRVSPITLGPGESTIIKWSYKAIERGAVSMKAYVSGRDPNTDELFFVSRERRIAIDVPSLEVSGIRLSPGAPVPGEFGLIRGTVTNIGSLDISDIDFAIEGTPKVEWVRRRLQELEPEVSPRIALLEVGESREFVIPFGMTTMADGLGSYRVQVTMRGTAKVDGEDVEVEHTAFGGGGLDLNTYWSNLLQEYLTAYWEDALDFFDGVNSWGDTSTVGGVVVGGGEGVLGALQTMGDGLLTTGEVAVNTVTGKYELTDKGLQLAQTISEYYQTHTLKEMGRDLLDAGITGVSRLDDLAIAGVGVMADWMHKVDSAYQQGDAREVSRLLAEAGTTIALTVGGEAAVEQVASKILTRVIKRPAPRKTMGDTHAAQTDDLVDLTPAQRAALEGDDLKAMPTGVSISRKVALRAGLSEKNLDWMQKMAKEHGVAFFARPRPAAAAKFADLGWNPKPMAIKFKSVNDIDVKWLGWDDYAGKEGLVCLRQPKDPWPEPMRAMEADEIKWGSQEVEAIVERYQRRKAEWKSVQTKIDELNAKNGGEGFDIMRDGEKVRTKAYLDDDGLLRFTHDGNPVYSDIDLLQVARPDGTPISKELHEKIMKAAGPGFDVQHGDTMSTSDFPDWETATKFVEEYGREHMRGGDPLVIVGADSTTLGYVKGFEYPDTVAGSNYDLYGKVTVRYEGAGWP